LEEIFDEKPNKCFVFDHKDTKACQGKRFTH
jgi:hypothetical protein